MRSSIILVAALTMSAIYIAHASDLESIASEYGVVVRDHMEKNGLGSFISSDDAKLREEITVFESLPVGALIFKERRNGDLLIATQNGRFVIDGVVIDTWTGASLETLDDVRTATSTVALDDVGKALSSIALFKVGHGPTEISIFLDPLCPHCERLLSVLPQNSKDYTFNILPIPVLGESSLNAVVRLECAKNRSAAKEALFGGDYNALTEFVDNCSQENLSKRMMSAQVVGVDVVPFLVGPKGKILKGAPTSSFSEWISEISK